MKAVVLDGRSLQYMELPLTSLPLQWARVKVESVGLCGTDVGKIMYCNLPSSHTQILGHEFVGQITEVNGHSNEISTGDWVICMPLMACGVCDACVQHKENLCVKAASLGRTIQGAFAESVNVPLENLTKVSMFHESYVLADPLAVCLHAVNLVKKPMLGFTSLVMGDGAIGCLLTWLLLRRGHQVSIKGVHAENLQLAKSFGAHVLESDVAPQLYDEVFETVGRSQSQTFEQSVRAVKAGGTVVVLGVFSPGYIYPLNARELFIKEAVVLGANAYTKAEFQEAVDLIDCHKVELTAFLSHTFPLSKFLDALEVARNKEGFVMKIVLKPGG